jgi:hypothetical protein
VNITKTSKNVYPYIYIYIYINVGQQCHQNVYIHIEYIVYKIRRPVKHLGTKLVSPHQTGSPAYIIYKKIHREMLMVPLDHHLLALPQAVVPHPLSVPPDLEVITRSSQHLLLLLVEPRSTTSVELLHTTLGRPHPRCMTKCPQAHPVAPPPSGDEYPQNLPCPWPEEHVMALHQGRQNNVS